MARTWKLDSETKGTGAHVAPLQGRSERARDGDELATHTFQRPQRRTRAREPVSRARAFKVVDVMSARVLAEDVGAREAIAALAGMRGTVDARVYVREPFARRWRLLSRAEHGALWRFRASEAFRR